LFDLRRDSEEGEWWKISPSVLHFKGGRDVAKEWWCWALVVFLFDLRREGSGGEERGNPPRHIDVPAKTVSTMR